MLARTKTHPTNSYTESQHVTLTKNTMWTNLFENELKTHNEKGLYLKGLRLREGYTQKDLGTLIGISRHRISEIEHGKKLINKDIALELAKVFKVNYQRFL